LNEAEYKLVGHLFGLGIARLSKGVRC